MQKRRATPLLPQDEFSLNFDATIRLVLILISACVRFVFLCFFESSTLGFWVILSYLFYQFYL